MNLRKILRFIWQSDSVLSWIINLIIAIILVKFVIYPGLGLLLGTGYPVVAVVSGSMEHNVDFDEWWELNKGFYEKNGIMREEFEEFDFENGFNKGDIFVVKEINELELGDIIVYSNLRQQTPIIHRIVEKGEDEEGAYFVTKGDNSLVDDGKVRFSEVEHVLVGLVY